MLKTATASSLEKMDRLVKLLQEELAATNQEVLMLTLELEDRVEERTRQLSAANEALRNEITERKRAEAEIQKLNDDLIKRAELLEAARESAASFSAAVSHDLRAPLAAINGFTAILLEDHAQNLDEEGIDALNRVRNAGKKMQALIQGLLKLSGVTQAELNIAKVSLTGVARSIAKDLQEEEPGRHVKFDIEPDLTVSGDERLLRIALENLIRNSWKFTSKLDDALIVVGRESDDEGQPFFVRDNGVGFDKAHADKLFKPFARLHSPQEFPGTGIGLTTVSQIIRKHGGTVWATAEEGHGACFLFTLPTNVGVSVL